MDKQACCDNGHRFNVLFSGRRHGIQRLADRESFAVKCPECLENVAIQAGEAAGTMCVLRLEELSAGAEPISLAAQIEVLEELQRSTIRRYVVTDVNSPDFGYMLDEASDHEFLSLEATVRLLREWEAKSGVAV